MYLKRERHYFIWFFISLVIVTACAITSFVFSAIDIAKNNSMGDCFFEFFYAAIHILISATALVFSFLSVKTKKSRFMKPLMFNEYGKRSKPAFIICIIFAIIGLALIIYFSLSLFGVVPSINFSFTLRLVLVNVGLIILDFALFFMFYPMVIKE